MGAQPAGGDGYQPVDPDDGLQGEGAVPVVRRQDGGEPRDQLESLHDAADRQRIGDERDGIHQRHQLRELHRHLEKTAAADQPPHKAVRAVRSRAIELVQSENLGIGDTPTVDLEGADTEHAESRAVISEQSAFRAGTLASTSSPRCGPTPEMSRRPAGIQAMGRFIKHDADLRRKASADKGLAKFASYCVEQ